VAFLALVFSALVGATAGAADWQECAAERFCIYTDADGQGTVAGFGPANPVQVYSAEWDERVSSVHNNTAYWACVYEDAYYGGTVQAIRPGYRGNLAETSTQLDNKVSSHKLAKSKAGCFTGFERCRTGYLCLFTEPAGRGAMTATQLDIARYSTVWNDKVVSVANHTDRHACFYEGADYSGSWPDAGKTYTKYVVLASDATMIPRPYAATFTSHKLVTGTSLC
jgi:hypothetical protein